MRSKRDPEKILIVTLSNVGDVFLTLPVVGAIRRAYPSAVLSVLVGQRAKDIFENDPRLHEWIPYDKQASLSEKWRFVRRLRREKFDLVVDLRHSLFPILLGVSSHTPLFLQPPRRLFHKMDRHLWRVERLGVPVESWRDDSIWIRPEAVEEVERRLRAFGIRPEDPFVLLSPGSKSRLKQWKASSYAALSDRLSKEKKIPVVFVGEATDRPFMDEISSHHETPYSLVGETSLPELVALIRRARLLVTNDNATLHIASLLGTPTVALFGPTDPRKYGPRAEKSRVVRKQLFCSPCEKAHCPYHHECMEQLPVEEVYQACSELL